MTSAGWLQEMTQAVLDAALIFFIPFVCYLYPADIWSDKGYAGGIWVFGTSVYSKLPPLPPSPSRPPPPLPSDTNTHTCNLLLNYT